MADDFAAMVAEPVVESRVKPIPGIPGAYEAPGDEEMSGGPGRMHQFSFAPHPFIWIEDNGDSCTVMSPGMALYLAVPAREVREAYAGWLKEKSGSGEQLETVGVTGLEDM